MHAGKHQEYEKKLHEALLNKNSQSEGKQTSTKCKENGSATPTAAVPVSNSTNKENWPQLNQDKIDSGKTETKKTETIKDGKGKSKSKSKNFNNNNNSVDKKLEKGKNCETVCQRSEKLEENKSSNEENTLKLPATHDDDDNSSFFSRSVFQKIVDECTPPQDESSPEPPTVLNENVLDINNTEDWEAAFGFSNHSNHLEELANQRNVNVKEIFGSDFGIPNDQHNTTYPHNGCKVKWLQENVLDALSTNKNGFQELPRPNLNGFDQHMSKFFTDFCKQNVQNGFLNNTEHQSYRMLHHKQQMEEQLMNLNLKSSYNPPNGVINSSQFLNGDIVQNTFDNNQLYQGSSSSSSIQNRTLAEDELDFDPFQETQKGLAELIENEQNHKMHSRSSAPMNQMNGMLHGQLPPPPGFLQQSTHMNSFGSKILPYLNMKSSTQQQPFTNNSAHNNWPGSYTQVQQQQQQQHKGGKLLSF